MRVNGNTEGIKDTYIEALDKLYDMECSKDDAIDRDMANILSDITEKTKKEISVFISRRGKVLDVTIGDYSTVNLPAMDMRRGDKRLSGIRCVHTHPSGGGHLSSVDISALIGLRLDAMIAIGVRKGEAYEFYAGFLSVENGRLSGKYNIIGPFDNNTIHKIDIQKAVLDIEKEILPCNTDNTAEGYKERVLLVGLSLPGGEGSSEDLLNELEELSDTAGAEVAGKLLQKRSRIDNAYYIGSGKVKELSLICQAYDIDTIIFDDELSGVQIKNIEEAAGVRVIDRTALILEIFAKRAQTREGKLQVELAQLKYRLPRLIGLGRELSKLGGGIGTRGPGEKKLELDRRHIRKRIDELNSELEEIRKNRNLQRRKRLSSMIPIISLVGYTNSGKSTLRNALSKMYPSDKYLKKEDVLEADMLFATLDPTTRMIKLPKGHDVLVSDTVGFIRKLPHDLVDAFRSTLEEVVYSDMLIHVVDASAENAAEQINAVNDVLAQLNVSDKPTITAFNKVDKLKCSEPIDLLRANNRDAVEISALYGKGIEDLVSKIECMLFKNIEKAALMIPYANMGIKSLIYHEFHVLSEEYKEDGLLIEAEGERESFTKFSSYIINDKKH